MTESLSRRQAIIEEIREQFPFAVDWIVQHSRAQILRDKRLASPEEKIELFGGVEQVKSNIAILPANQRIDNMLLLACRQSPMVGYEIIRFAEAIGQRITIASLYTSIYRLIHSEAENGSQLQVIEGITYIYKMPGTSEVFTVAQRKGFLTTDIGTRVLALNLSRQQTASNLRGLLHPEPQV